MRSEVSRQRGSVLLEVVLAVVLFAAAATVIGVGLKASMDSSERLRMGTHAGNLAITVASELQMGVRSLADTGPEAFGPPFEGWVWEIAAMPWNETEGAANDLVQVEVIVRHEPTGFVHRFAQVMQLDATTAADGSMSSMTPPAATGP
jgi:type II secretory pathway pseudopilin PulG